jgi:hypothetical protein
MKKIEIAKTEQVEETELSGIEHTRILSVLDAVATLSERISQPVSNRNHDHYLYGGESVDGDKIVE